MQVKAKVDLEPLEQCGEHAQLEQVPTHHLASRAMLQLHSNGLSIRELRLVHLRNGGGRQGLPLKVREDLH